MTPDLAAVLTHYRTVVGRDGAGCYAEVHCLQPHEPYTHVVCDIDPGGDMLSVLVAIINHHHANH